MTATTAKKEIMPALSRRGILGSIAASFGAATGFAASPALAEAILPSQTPTPAAVKEFPEFLDLVERIRNSAGELPSAEAEERAAEQRFVAMAPLPSRELQRRADKDGERQIRLKIVRDKLPFDQRFKPKPKKVGDPIYVAVSVCEAYNELRTKLPGTGDGDAYRRLTGITWRYEGSLFASAHQTGYRDALLRRIILENDLFAAVGELLTHKPKTAAGLRVQAGACLIDPGFRWGSVPRLQAFLFSTMEFGMPVPTQEGEAA